jgi:hypothetical protein
MYKMPLVSVATGVRSVVYPSANDLPTGVPLDESEQL